MQIDRDKRAVVAVATVRMQIAEGRLRGRIRSWNREPHGCGHRQHSGVAQRTNGYTRIVVAELNGAEP